MISEVIQMDEKDYLFIAELRKNARASLTNISKKIHVPISTLFDRLKEHQKTLITKHVSLLDFTQLGYVCNALTIFKVVKEDRDKLKNYLLHHDHVNNIARINNGYDFMVEVIFKNVKDLEDFLEAIEGKHRIIEKSVYYIIEQISRETFMNSYLEHSKKRQITKLSKN